MAQLRFRKPNMSAVWGEIIALAVWLFFGDRVIDVLDRLVGDVDNSTFEDAFKIMGIGNTAGVANSSNGLLGIVALVLVVMILMNFIQYR